MLLLSLFDLVTPAQEQHDDCAQSVEQRWLRNDDGHAGRLRYRYWWLAHCSTALTPCPPSRRSKLLFLTRNLLGWCLAPRRRMLDFRTGLGADEDDET